MSMASALISTLVVPEHATVPRRPMGLMPLLVSHICDPASLPTVELTELTPVRSMFDYDPDTAVAVTDVPRPSA